MTGCTGAVNGGLQGMHMGWQGKNTGSDRERQGIFILTGVLEPEVFVWNLRGIFSVSTCTDFAKMLIWLNYLKWYAKYSIHWPVSTETWPKLQFIKIDNFYWSVMKNAASLTFHKHIIKIIKPWAMDSTTTIGILANKLKIRSTFIFILKLRKIQAFINIKMDKNNTCNTTHKCICMHFYLYSLLISRIIIFAFSSFCNF